MAHDAEVKKAFSDGVKHVAQSLVRLRVMAVFAFGDYPQHYFLIKC